VTTVHFQVLEGGGGEDGLNILQLNLPMACTFTMQFCNLYAKVPTLSCITAAKIQSNPILSGASFLAYEGAMAPAALPLALDCLSPYCLSTKIKASNAV
jgi:hypothetical protein